MGKSYSKQEEKEVIITQNAAGSNQGQGIAEQAEHMQVNNVLVTVLLFIFGFAALVFIYRGYKRCHQKWMQKEIRGDIIRRIRSRISGRRWERDTQKDGAGMEVGEENL